MTQDGLRGKMEKRKEKRRHKVKNGKKREKGGKRKFVYLKMQYK